MHNDQPASQGNHKPAPYKPQGPKPAYQGGGGPHRPYQRRDDRPLEKGKHRINLNIRVPEVRVVQDGKQLGVMRTSEAMALATEAGLDLVEIAPQGRPPVCSIMDYGQFKYQEKIKQKENDKKQRESAHQLKEIRLSPTIGDHDVGVKVKQAKGFLAEGKKVQLVVVFQRRQLSHKDMGFEVAKKFIESLGEEITVESPPKLEGNKLTCRVAAKQ